jgi:hypothetical protein
MIVSEDIPLASTLLSTVTSGLTPPCITVDSHVDSTAGMVLVSRPERCRCATSVCTVGRLVT